MRSSRLTAPAAVSKPLLRLFGAYVDWYLRRNFHAVRTVGAEQPIEFEQTPLLVVLNHPSWWDPLFALTLARHLWPTRTHYAPMETHALNRYAFFRKIGFFGIEPGTARGAAEFLRSGEAILQAPGSALWVTAQGAFTDPRVRPVVLREGVGHLLHRAKNVIALPVALEYPFWEERYAEALACLGEPILVCDGREKQSFEWTAAVGRGLEKAQDHLQDLATRRARSEFQVLATGRAGASVVYDLWRYAKAVLRGERFQRAHGSEHS